MRILKNVNKKTQNLNFIKLRYINNNFKKKLYYKFEDFNKKKKKITLFYSL